VAAWDAVARKSHSGDNVCSQETLPPCRLESSCSATWTCFRRQVQPVPAAPVLGRVADLGRKARRTVVEELVVADSCGVEIADRHVAEPVTVDVDRRHPVHLAVERRSALRAGRPVSDQTVRRAPGGTAGAPHPLRAPIHLDVRVVGVMRNQVDHAGDRARAISRRAAAPDHLDAVDQPRRQLLDAVDHGQRRQRRLTVDQKLRVRSVEPQQPDLGGVAALTGRLHADSTRPLDRVGQRTRDGALDLQARDRLHVKWNVLQAFLRPRGGDHHLLPERRTKLNGEFHQRLVIDTEVPLGEAVPLRVDHQAVFTGAHRV